MTDSPETAPFPLREKLTALEDFERYFTSDALELQEGMRRYQEAEKLAKEIVAYLETARTELHRLADESAADEDPFEG